MSLGFGNGVGGDGPGLVNVSASGFIKNIFYWFLRGGILYFYIKGHHQLTGKERVELFLSESAYGVT